MQAARIQLMCILENRRERLSISLGTLVCTDSIEVPVDTARVCGGLGDLSGLAGALPGLSA